MKVTGRMSAGDLWSQTASILLVLMCCSTSCFAALPTIDIDDKLIGWRPDAAPEQPQPALTLNSQYSDNQFDPERDPWVETVSWAPRAQIFHNFLSEAECEYVIKTAAPQMKRSTVVGAHGESVEDPIRTSYGTFLRRLQDDTMITIQQRVATWTHLPMVNQEDMQVLRYGLGQKYGAHYDSHEDESPGPKHRVATVLLYLNDCPEGGETAFPLSKNWVDPKVYDKYAPFSKCADEHVAWKPRKGSALLFFTLGADGQQDVASMHTGCPIIRGYKWTATIWIHTEPFRPETFVKPNPNDTPLDPGICKDYNAMCDTWASAGECTKNPGYMVVGGNCRKACKDCQVCADGDTACFNSNRDKGGFLTLTKVEMDSLGVKIIGVNA